MHVCRQNLKQSSLTCKFCLRPDSLLALSKMKELPFQIIIKKLSPQEEQGSGACTENYGGKGLFCQAGSWSISVTIFCISVDGLDKPWI